MKNGQTSARLSVAGKLPEGYIIHCRFGGDEYSFLVRALGISVECPHCGATRHGAELAQEYFLGKDVATKSPIGIMTRSHHAALRPKSAGGPAT
jgi:hypothetical protein